MIHNQRRDRPLRSYKFESELFFLRFEDRWRGRLILFSRIPQLEPLAPVESFGLMTETSYVGSFGWPCCSVEATGWVIEALHWLTAQRHDAAMQSLPALKPMHVLLFTTVAIGVCVLRARGQSVSAHP
jgi:hypothetical protein